MERLEMRINLVDEDETNEQTKKEQHIWYLLLTLLLQSITVKHTMRKNRKVQVRKGWGCCCPRLGGKNSSFRLTLTKDLLRACA